MVDTSYEVGAYKSLIMIGNYLGIRSDVGIELSTHQNRIDSAVLSPRFPNSNELNIVKIILTDNSRNCSYCI